MDKMQRRQDRWVISQIQKIPKGSLILDIGAGWGRYKKYCSHLRYESQDFCQVDRNNLRNQYIEHNYVCENIFPRIGKIRKSEEVISGLR